MKISNSNRFRKYLIGLVALGLFIGSASLASGAINSSASGYNFCVNNTTKIVSFPAATKCPKGSTLINFGAQGAAGENGAAGVQGAKGDSAAPGVQGAKGDTGAIGLPGINGLNGTSLLGGIGVPNNTLGNNGDMYIDKNGAVIFGPKSSGLWGYGTAFGGPAGATGATGATGASTAATLGFISATNDGPVPATGVLPTYGTGFQTILSVTIPSAGSYWASFYTEIWEGPNQTIAVLALCQITKNGNGIISQSQNNNKHFMQSLVSNVLAGDVISLVCAQNGAGNAKAFRASGYALRVGA